MSIIVLGMEMPSGCDDCKLRYRHQGAYVTDHCFYNMKIIDPWTFGRSRNGCKPDWCPLRPLPEKHGRLGDLDEIMNKLAKDKREAFTKHDVWLMFSRYGAETIVEAEGKDDD